MMIDYENLPKHNVLCIDMKSFYASIECVRRGLDPMTTHLIVIGDRTRSGSVILASSPAMKRDFNIKATHRLFEVPDDPRIIIAEAHMGDYLKISMGITKLFNEFVPVEAIHTYSVDESWLCVDGTEKLFGDRWEVAKKIKDKILNVYGLPSCVGIGPNKFLAKVILDTEAKREGIAECRYEDIPQKLWPLPLIDVWGIGRRMERNLNRFGITTLGQLANYPLHILKRRFGVMGEQLYYHANGVDLSPVIGSSHYTEQKGIGHGITLLRDYDNRNEIETVILELSEEVARRTRKARMAGRTIHFGCGFSKTEGGGGFSRSRSLDNYTNLTSDIYKVCLQLFDENYRGEVVRQINVSITNLASDDHIQLDLFNDVSKKHDLGYAMDAIRDKFGSGALLRARSYTPGGVMLDRVSKIGGHRA
ncbi:DNA polymerase V [Pullulanibacillus pueri]|uniref:Putative UV-damage repair protein UvrX n=1 Tax=Pullulanibacillus pueri TaxID=1437324 RepID=A0A8J3EM38_9BACL|nr:DNA polymerase IV [Pullulanibacillus pueri]MBM7682252.1 DNA polymerase V [Pullulanibacillus pueri]GGH81082.1 putative UV-damage repair protein UvrX [Pullulanibacillus pueri]